MGLQYDRCDVGIPGAAGRVAPERRGAFLAEAAGADEEIEIRHAVEMLLAPSSPRTSPSPYAQVAAPVTTLPDGFRLGPYEVSPRSE
jgi:hypothetical protein